MKSYYPKDKAGNVIGLKIPESEVYDTDGKSLTEKLADVGGSSNLNLLYNWDFRYPVDIQYVGTNYWTPDVEGLSRWMTGATNGVKYVEGTGLTMELVDNCYIEQIIYRKFSASPKTATLLINNTYYQSTTIGLGPDAWGGEIKLDGIRLVFSVYTNTNNPGFLYSRMTLDKASSTKALTGLQKIKIEEGSKSTLKDDPEIDKYKELTVCSQIDVNGYWKDPNALYVPQTRTINGKVLSSNISFNGWDTDGFRWFKGYGYEAFFTSSGEQNYDLDGWVKPGIFNVSSACLHVPTAYTSNSWGTVLIAGAESGIMQFYFDWSGSGGRINGIRPIWVRTSFDWTWTDWVSLSQDYGTSSLTAGTTGLPSGLQYLQYE